MLKLQFTIDAVDRVTAKLAGINKAVDRAAAPYRKLRASINSLAENSGIDRLGAATGRLRERFGNLPLLATAATGGVVAGLVQTIRRIDQLQDSAKKLGVPIEQLQRMGYAAQMSGSSQEEMASSLQFLSQNMAEALSGSKEMQLNFRRAGLEMSQLRKMNAAQVFEAIADKFEKVGNAGQNAEKKIQLTRALMGRGGAEMIQMLNQGSGAFKALYAEADRAGVVSAEMAGRFGDAADSLDRMVFGANGFLATLTSAALPGIERLVSKFTEMGAEGRAAFAEKIGAGIGKLLDKLPQLLANLAAIAGAIGLLVEKATFVADLFGGWDTIIVMVSSAIVGKGVWALGLLARAFWTVGAAVAMTPVGWFMAAVAAIAGAVYLVYKHWEPIKKWFKDLWDGIVAKFDWAKNKIGGWIPDWMKSGADQPYPVTTGAIRPSIVAAPEGSPFRANLGGTLKIEIDADGKPRVREMRKAPGSVVDFDVYSGAAMGMP
jgi:hypothetical protein